MIPLIMSYKLDYEISPTQLLTNTKLIEDNNQAEIRAKFYMFKDIVESVDALFSSKEYIDNGKVKKSVLNIFSSMASMLPGLA